MTTSSLLVLVLAAGADKAAEKTFRLADSVEMAYVDRGKGDPALVFIHCGNCRKEIWQETLDAFSGDHRVVAMDLPGHGRSGALRERWTLPLLGADVAALVDHLKLDKVVLVGNSLGGPVAVEAARRLGPARVLGIVAVDTLQNVEAKWPEDALQRVLNAYRMDFKKGCAALMLGPLLPKDAPAAIRQRIDDLTCGNNPRAAIALLESMGSYDQAGALRNLGVPIWAINATLFPTEVETNRKYAPSFQVILVEGVGHYPQVERPAEFQEDLRRVLRSLSSPGH
jgi:pimeloyl-ACP methyl ester carboxylesterase